MGNIINGTNSADNLSASANGDTLNGLGGNDILTGGNSPDVINGGAGNDFINVRGKGNDTVDGGDGLDRVTYYSTAGALTVNLETGEADDGSGFIDHLTSIERISGSSGYSDVIIGRADTDETLYGNAGNDTLDGGVGGSDTTGYSFVQPGAGGVMVNLAAGTSSGPDGNDVLSNFENVEGSRFNDTLIGDNGGNILWGLGGDDQLIGAGGNDTLIGGAGNDTAIFTGNRSDYTLTTLDNGDVTVQDNRDGSPDGTDVVRGVKFLQFADTTLAAVAQAQVANGETAGAQLSQASVMLKGTGGAGANGYVTVFRANDASGDGIYVRLFDGDGQPRSDDIAVNTTTSGDQRVPGVAALTDGGFVVIWDSTPENYPYTNQALQEIKLQRFDENGNKVGAEVEVNTTTDYLQRFPSVIDTADGGYLAVWQSRHESGGTSTGIYAQKFDASGAKTGAELHINTTTAGNQQLPLVRHVGTDGSMVVVWQGTLSSGANGFAQQLLDAAGNKVGAEQIVYTAPTGAVINFTHETQLSNGYVLSWTVTLTNGSGAVMAQVFNLDGSARGNAFTAAAGERYRGSDLIETANGDIMLVWDVTHSDGSSEIVGRNFNPATGLASGALFRVSDDLTSINAGYPTLSPSGNGDIMVNWSSLVTPSANGSGAVFQQLINGNGEREYGVFDTGTAPAATSFTVQTVAGGAMPQLNSLGEYVLSAAANSGDTVSGQHLSLNGTAAYGSRITIYAGETALVTVSTDDGGKWSADIKQLNDGVYHLTAVVSDMFGHSSEPSAAFELTIQSVASIDGTSGADNAQYWFNNGASSAAQVLNGGNGNDTLNGGGGADTLNGGAGDDTYLWNDGVVINEDADSGTDTILSDYGMVLPDHVENMTNTTSANNGMFGNALNNVLKGGSGADFIDGSSGNDTLWGNGNNDNLMGGEGDDVELGGDGDDYFIGGLADGGNDLMDGGAGNDFLNLSAGHDTILGGAGDEDRLYAAVPGATHGVNLNLATNVIVDNGLGENGVISGIEDVRGSQFADTVIGGSADELFYGNGGNDSMDGGAGFDAFIYGGKQAFTGSLASGTGSSSDGTVHFSNVEALGGGSGNDSLTGSANADVLGGFLGNDTLAGMGGNDTLYGDGGNDTAVFRGNKADYKISTNADGSVTVQDKRATGATLDGTDTLIGVRNLKFADGNVELKAVDQVVSSNTGGYQIYQSTAAHWYRDGGYLEVFRATDGSGDGLYARTFDEDGNPMRSDVLINAGNTGGDQRAPVVAALQFGGYAVAYHSNPNLGAAYNDAGWDIKVQVLDNAGNLVGGTVSVSTTVDVGQRLPTVAGLDFGGFAVAWQSAQAGEDGHLAIYARMFAANGQPYGPEIQVGTVSDYSQSGPAIVGQANNQAIVIWSGITDDGHYGFIEQRLDGNGNKLGEPQVVFTTPDEVAQLSVVHAARMADGGHVLTWIYDADGGGSGQDVVMACNYNSEGVPVGAAFVVSSAGAQASSSVLGLSDGSYMVVWDVENADGTSAIMGRRYSGSDNNALTAEFKISNSPAAGIKMFPTLAEFQDGRVVVSWGTQGVQEITSSGGIYQQVIDFNGNPLFYAGDNSGTKPAATTITVQTVVGGSSPVLDPAYPSAAYYLKDAPLSSGATVSNSHVIVSGTAAARSIITIKDGATVLGTVAVDDDGRWALDVKSLANGAHALTATVTDIYGAASVASGAFNLTINGTLAGTAGADGEAYWISRGANGNAQSLSGLDGNDTLNGGGGKDTLTGGAGDDTYIITDATATVVEAAGGGVDTVRSAVNLTLAANVENGAVLGSAGLALTGNAVNNLLGGGDGNDTLSGGSGNDTLQGGNGDDTYMVDAAGDVIVEDDEGGYDTVQVALTAAGSYTLASNLENALAAGTVAINLTGNDADNQLTGNSAANILIGNGGNDTLTGGAGNDTLTGGDGDDVYVVDAVGDVINEGSEGGTDTVRTALASYTLTAANVEKLVYIGSSAFTGTGAAGNQAIIGGVGADTLNGAAGNDTLNGGAGNDSLLGGEGDDLFVSSAGTDLADGGNGGDTVQLAGARIDYTVQRLNATDTKLTSLSSGDSITIRNVETVKFGDDSWSFDELVFNVASPANDTIIGSGDDDTLNGGPGADTLRGFDGDDTYYVDNKDDVIEEGDGEDSGIDHVMVALAAAGTYTLAANVEYATVTAAASVAVNLIGNGLDNNLTGNAAANLLSGNDGDDVLDGGAGNDTLSGGDGDDLMSGGAGNDSMSGGGGDDVYLVDSATDVVVEAAEGGRDKVVTSLAAYTLTANVEELSYSGSLAFSGKGNALDNMIDGGSGNDTLSGEAGHDVLNGRAGNDSLAGGAGDDFLGGDAGNDVLAGGAGSDFIAGGAGNDSIDGGEILDRITYSDGNYAAYFGATAGVNVNLATGVAQDGQGGTDKLVNINMVYGSGFNDTITGSTTLVGEFFNAAGGDNTIDGGAITDTINQVNSNLVYYWDSESVAVDLQTGVAVHDGAQDTLLNINQLVGSSGNDTLYGSDSAISESFDGLGGDNEIDGRGGFDFVRYDFAELGISVNLAEGTAFNGSGTDTLSGIEGVYGSWLDDQITGSDAETEVFIGGAGNDSIDGGSGYDRADYTTSRAAVTVNLDTGTASDGLGGTDTLENIEGVRGSGFNDTLLGSDAEYQTFEGREGNDSIDGKGGEDLVSYESSKAGAVVNLVTGSATDGWGSTDKLLNIEDVRGSTFNDSITGNAGANWLEGLAGNDTLLGGAGDDALFAGKGVDLADGGADTDSLLLLGEYEDYTITRPNATDLLLVNTVTGENITARNIETFFFADGERSYGETIANKVSAFADVLTGSNGADTLNGLGGADTMSGGDGDDTYVVDVAGDVIVETAGNDKVEVALTAAATYTLAAGVENATVTSAATIAVSLAGNASNNTLSGNAAANTLAGGAGNDSLSGGLGNDSLLGGADNDTLDGGAGNDTMVGGSGNDLYYIDAATDLVTEALDGGYDRAYVTLNTYVLAANVDRLEYKGAGNFNGTGNALDNDIYGGAGNDTLNGGAGSDALFGNEGNDSVLGGDGDDAIIVGTGASDVADGGQGNDTVGLEGNFADFVRSRTSVTDTKLVNSITDEAVTIRNVETVLFNGVSYTLDQVNFNLASAGNDVLTGGDAADTIDGGLGNDSIAGGKGSDTYVVDAAGDVVTELADEGDADLVQVAFKAAGTYTLSANIENATVTSALAINLVGNGADNVLTGNAAANKLSGGAGNDKLVGGIGNDSMDGGAGNDVYVVDVAGDVVTELAGGGTDRVETTAATLVLANFVENLTYTGSGNFTGTGNTLDNEIIGKTGNDTLTGGVGNDTLRGGAGNDSLLGGDGNDALYAGVGTADIVDGGLGDDKVFVDGSFEDYTRSRLSATDTKLVNNVTGETLTIRNVETVSFADGDRLLAAVNDNLASAGNDNLTGGDGNDTINGGAGVDTMSGMQGDDTYVVDVAGDVVTELEDEGNDSVNVAYTAAATYTLGANIENATVTGTAAINLTGNALDNILTGNAVGNKLTGGAGNDKLIGGAGVDTLDGGIGDDVYVVDVAGDVVTEGVGAGTDRVDTTASTLVLAANVENLSFIGSGGFNGTGNALDNEIIGKTGNDTLTGGIGNDTLRGDAGNDSLVGGEGNDALYAGAGTADVIDGGAGDNDLVYVAGNFGAYTRSRVSLTETKLVNASTGESLTIRNVETVHFADGDQALSLIIAGLASPGGDSLMGSSGADTLDGQGGADTMTGFAGNDTYVVDVAGDLVFEQSGQGTDLVQVNLVAAGSYTLSANVENGTVTGTLASSIVGNTLDNVLTGNAAANKLTGDAGNDTLDGGAGNDSLIGGAGNDVYYVDASDTITEAADGGLDIVLTSLASYTMAANTEWLWYTGGGSFKGTGNALANLMTGSSGKDSLSGGDGNDSLSGNQGNDTLLGGNGDDFLYGGAGDDLLTGGAGGDVFSLESTLNVDTISDFTTGTDKINLFQGEGYAIGNRDGVIDGGVLRSAPGGFDSSAELVIFSNNVAGATPAKAAVATAIGSANSAYSEGQQVLFVVDNGSNSYLYLFRSGGDDALVSADELTQIAILTGKPATVLNDYQFSAFEF